MTHQPTASWRTQTGAYPAVMAWVPAVGGHPGRLLRRWLSGRSFVVGGVSVEKSSGSVVAHRGSGVIDVAPP